MLGLAEMLKRKHKHIYNEHAIRDKVGRTDQANAGFSIAGLEEKFSTKAAMLRAWAISQSKTATPIQGTSTVPSRVQSRTMDEAVRMDGTWSPGIDLPMDDMSSLGASVEGFADGDRILNSEGKFTIKVVSEAASSRETHCPLKILSKAAADLISEIER